MAMTAVARAAAQCGFPDTEVESLRKSNTVEAVVESLRDHPRGRELWCGIEKQISAAVLARLNRVERVETRLFGLRGVALGQAA
jgi:cobalamin biosynthesis protein CbiD